MIILSAAALILCQAAAQQVPQRSDKDLGRRLERVRELYNNDLQKGGKHRPRHPFDSKNLDHRYKRCFSELSAYSFDELLFVIDGSDIHVKSLQFSDELVGKREIKPHFP